MEPPLSLLRAAARHAWVLARTGARRSGRRRLAGCLALLRQAAVRLRAGGLPALAALLDASVPASRTEPLEILLAEAEAVAAWWPQPGMRRCLRRAVLRYVTLRGGGVAAVLVIGARRTAGGRRLAGHAWVEVEGRPFREASDQWRGMTQMYRYPPAPGGAGRACERDRDALAASE